MSSECGLISHSSSSPLVVRLTIDRGRSWYVRTILGQPRVWVIGDERALHGS